MSALLITILATTAAADVDLSWAQRPRLAQTVPAVVRTAAPADYRATAEVRVRGKLIGRVVARGRSTAVRSRVPLLLGRSLRAKAAKEAARTRRAPRIAVTVRAGTSTATLRSDLRLAPFYDGRLRAPDAASRGFAVSWDLPFEFAQVYGALSGRPSIGTFRKTAAVACGVEFQGSATTSSRRGRLRGRVLDRGRRGPWRYERGPTEAVLSARAPVSLPGTRPYVVVRFRGMTCQAEVRRTLHASLRRAIRTARLRATAPQPGPGFQTA